MPYKSLYKCKDAFPDACKIHGTKLVFFDNTYMYPQDGRKLTEQTPFEPLGRKAKVRRTMAEMMLREIQSGELDHYMVYQVSYIEIIHEALVM